MQEKDHKNHDVVLESASALMDGEATQLDLRRVLKASTQDAAVASRWQRYHLVRASLQQEVHGRPAVNLLAGIHARLADAEHPVAARPYLFRVLWPTLAPQCKLPVLAGTCWLALPDPGLGQLICLKNSIDCNLPARIALLFSLQGSTRA